MAAAAPADGFATSTVLSNPVAQATFAVVAANGDDEGKGRPRGRSRPDPPAVAVALRPCGRRAHRDSEYNDGYDGTIPLSPILMPTGWMSVLPDGDSCTLHTFRAVAPDPQEAG
jgi:hypothetical protein